MEKSTQQWTELSHLFRNADVFIDKWFASVIMWSKPGGIRSLYDDGAKQINVFPITNTKYIPGSKVIFLISTHLSKCATDILQTVAETCLQCYIFVSISEESHMLELDYDSSLVGKWSQFGRGAKSSSYFDTVEAKIYEWIQLNTR
jgi:hypothetical protein